MTRALPLSLALLLPACMDGKAYDLAGEADTGRSSFTDDEDWGYDTGSAPAEDADTAAPEEDTAPTCDDASDSEATLYLSADDSNSQAAPVVARALIEDGGRLYANQREWEYLNYYTFDYAPAEEGTLRIVAQMREGDAEGDYDLLVAVVAPAMAPETRRPLNLTFSVDTSGSMSGHPLDMAKETMRTIASQLQEGDVVSIVQWSQTAAVILDSHVATGPNDADLLAEIAALETAGSTNLSNGLETAYRLAETNYSEGRTNRVVLISDGGANTGVTDELLIAEAAEDGESEGIYLIGVGASDPSSYNDFLMDTVTDLGKGAYLFVDSAEEAERQFTGERFLANLEVAAKDVRLAMTLPAGWLVSEFHGEEMSPDPDAVREQLLAPNDAMLYSLTLTDCGVDPDAPIAFSASWTEPRSGVAHTDEAVATVAAMLDRANTQIDKANALVAYAEALYDTELLDAASAEVDAAISLRPDDAELLEVRQTLDLYAARF